MLGSFASLLIRRLHFEEKGILWGRSKCPNCQKPLQAKNLVPILSWIFQKGKCHACGKKISVRYPLIEIVFILTFFCFAQKFYGNSHFFPLTGIVFFTLVLFFYDLWFLEVDNRIVFPAIFFVGIWAFFREIPVQDFFIGALAGFLFYGIQYTISRGKWVGFGDLWLGLYMGLVLGWKYLFLALILAYIAGTIAAIYLLAFKKYTRKSAVPMGAFLLPATLVFLYEGEAIWKWYWDLLVISY